MLVEFNKELSRMRVQIFINMYRWFIIYQYNIELWGKKLMVSIGNVLAAVSHTIGE